MNKKKEIPQQAFENDRSSVSDTADTPVDSNNGQDMNDREKLQKGSGETCRTKSVSLRKIEANRRNAGKSTGPKTSRGKKTVARNAVKFGFYSKFLLVKNSEEDRTEYDKLHANLRDQYEPADFLEELWVEKIAAWTWRLRRFMRAESGQIARSLAGHRYGVEQSKAMDLETPELAQSSSPEMDAMIDHLFLPSPEDLDKLLRYEAMISRQLNHATAELERLQARRKGESWEGS